MISNPVPRDAEPPCQADPERMFPVAQKSNEHALGIERAKAVCRTCPLVEPCFDYSIRFEVAGVWGNSSEEERQKHRQAKGIIPLPVVLSPYTMRVYRNRVDGAA